MSVLAVKQSTSGNVLHETAAQCLEEQSAARITLRECH